MAQIEISGPAAAAARAAVDTLVQTLEAEGKYPELSYVEAPLATAASDSTGSEWRSRLRSEVDGGEGLALAFTLAAEIFAEGDSTLKDALADVEFVISVDAGAA